MSLIPWNFKGDPEADLEHKRAATSHDCEAVMCEKAAREAVFETRAPIGRERTTRLTFTLSRYARGMWLRRAMYRWLIPAALVLPMWLLVGWGVFDVSGWAFLWVIFIAIPSVLIAQLILSLLVRARPSVADSRMLSWLDVAGFGVWHALTIFVGFYVQAWFGVALAAAILAAVGLFWLSLRQLRAELGQTGGTFMRMRQQVWTVRQEPEAGSVPQHDRTDPSQITIITDAPTDSDGPQFDSR